MPLSLIVAWTGCALLGGAPENLSACAADGRSALRLAAVEVRSDLLNIDVMHGDACREPTLRVCWHDESFLDHDPSVGVQMSVWQSPTPQRCDTTVDNPARIEVDLTPLRDAYADLYPVSSGTIVIELDGTTLDYTF